MSLVNRRSLVVSVLIAMSVTMAACADESMVDDPDLTKQAAIEKAVEYMERTQGALPEGLALSARSDAPGAVDPGVPNSGSLTCSGSDGADPDTDPQMVQLDYFVTGVPDGQNLKYLKQIRTLWESWGWKRTAEPKENWAAYANEDGYILRVRHSGSPGTLNIGGQTPCIAVENFTGGEDVPQQIGGTSS